MTDPPIFTPKDIRELRKRLGLTQEQLARRLDVTVSTVNRWENGIAKPMRVTRRALAQLAGTAG